MSRYVDIEPYEKDGWYLQRRYRNSYGESIVTAPLVSVPTADAEPTKHKGWILVTERLPEKNGRYLVTRGLNACGAMWNRVYLINYSDLMGLKSGRIWWNGNVGKSDFERIDDVIAWMPLPEPYREVEE